MTHLSTEGHRVTSAQLGSEGPNGGDILVAAMKDAGVEVAFGVISIHNLPLVQAVDRDLRFVPMRHEAKKALKKPRPTIIEVDVPALSPAPDAMVPPVEVP